MPRRKDRKEPKPFDPGLAGLARAVHSEQATVDPRRPPSAELCKAGQALADRLFIAEKRGEGLDAVLADPALKDLIVKAESDVSLPRPSGRWEIVLRDDSGTERVIGHAAGEWEVDTFRRLGASTGLKGRVGVDDAGREESLAPPRKQLDSEVARLGDAATTGTIWSAGVGGESLAVNAAAIAASTLLGDRPPRWHNDPTRRHDMRYWDGTTWTRFVFDVAAGAVPPE